MRGVFVAAVVLVALAAGCGGGSGKSDDGGGSGKSDEYLVMGYANALVKAAAVPGSGAAGFRISNATAGDYTAFLGARNGNVLHVLQNLPYVFSVDVVGEASAQQQTILQIEWKSAKGQVLGTSLGYPSNRPSVVLSGAGKTPHRVVVYGQSPAGAVTASPKIAITGNPPAKSAIFALTPRFRLATDGLKSSHPRPSSSRARSGSSYRYNPFGVWLNFGRLTGYDKRIPRVDYGGTLGVQTNPYTIAAAGLGWYSSFLYTRDRRQLRTAVRDANWLVEHQEADGRWLYHFPDVEYALQPPWTSAITQGAGISLLVRVWRRSKDSQYLKAAERALLPYSRPEERGGVLSSWGEHPFYQEAPNPARPSFILNGFMGSLLGLYDLSVAAPRSNAKTHYERGWDSLVAMLPLYDLGVGKSVYNLQYLTMGLTKKPASSSYNSVHVAELKAINSVSPSPILRYFMDRWSQP